MLQVGSVRVIQCGAALMIILSVIGKFGALFVTIPNPVIGGIFIIMFGMITAVGLSSLHFVDLESVRNLFVIGTALFFGMVLPSWVQKNGKLIDVGELFFCCCFLSCFVCCLFICFGVCAWM